MRRQPHLLRRRRRRCRGAAALLVLYACAALAVGGFGSMIVAGVAQSDARVQTAADAAAHAAEAALLADGQRFTLSADLQAHRSACTGDWARADDRDPEVHLDSDLCRRAQRAAEDAARANESHAFLIGFTVGPDTRDLHHDNSPGLLAVIVEVAIARHLPVLGRDCVAPEPQGRSADLCWAVAEAAAQPAG